LEVAPPAVGTRLPDSYPTYQRGLFRIPPVANVTIDISFPSTVTVGCEYGVPTRSKIEPTPYPCGGSVSFPVPSKDGTPFELFIGFERCESSAGGCIYSAGQDSVQKTHRTQVFVAYNLFTLMADHVTYNSGDRILQADGRVMAEGADGRKRHAESMTFEIVDGEAVSVKSN